MMRSYIFLFLYFLTGSFLHAQDSTGIQKSFSLSQGFTHIINKDFYRSPYNYKGLNSTTEISFERSSSKSIHRAYAGGVFGTVKTDFSPLAPSSLLNVNYSYLRKIINGTRFNLYMGPQLNGLSWKVNYFPEMQVPQYAKVRSYMLDFSLGIAASLTYKINSKNYLQLFLSTPVCAYVDRPHFLDGSPRQIQVGIFNSWTPQVRFTYEHSISEKFSVLINYQYGYLEYAKPKTIRILTNGITLGLKLKF